ncbi:MAG: geranylgeranyl reductase family protein [Syntrophales bacterium]|nr:geranylgeranyl reductase family protein [Syntrophales bacterium]MCK9528761.1 geranylgeranyl reductase family protein [Syntrophales bacterium]MDX9922499.1 geranylgeranyl reductase family protein [Syntrophales bacterium]
MFDCVVVGAGPAGASAGRKAARRGLKTLLVEKEEFPRYKPCAGALSRRAFSSLDFSLPEGLREKDIFGLRLCFRGRAIEERCDDPIAITVTRSRFDHYLLEKAREAGTLVHTGEKVLGLEERDDFVRVRTRLSTYDARYVIVGEGARGSLKNLFGRRRDRRDVALSMVAEVEAPNRVIDERLPGLLEIHADLFRMGYCWVFPHDGYFSVGLWGFAPFLRDPRSLMKQFIMRAGFPEDTRFRGHLMPTGDSGGVPATARILATGDAAGFIDPLTGEGISYAIISGRMAGDAVADRLRGAGLSERFGLDQYEERCRREFARNFASARRMAQTVYRFPSFFFELLSRDRELYRKLLEAPELKGLYGDYLRWLLPRLHRSLFYCLKGRLLRQDR